MDLSLLPLAINWLSFDIATHKTFKNNYLKRKIYLLKVSLNLFTLSVWLYKIYITLPLSTLTIYMLLAKSPWIINLLSIEKVIERV
jgi:hypothetical protein